MKTPFAGADADSAPVMLPALQFMRLRRARGRRIVCLSGTALITVSDVLQDIELHASAGFVVPNDGLVLIEAVTAARLMVEKRVCRQDGDGRV